MGKRRNLAWLFRSRRQELGAIFLTPRTPDFIL